jgi:ABC-type lipoprotein export system ATPase subunit
MSRLDFVVSSDIKQTIRVKQLSALFDVPAQDRMTHRWQGDVPLDERSWNVGLIVGPSGSGKTMVARQLFGELSSLTWQSASMIDDFDPALSMNDITEACSAVGFNTIPAWMKPHAVLSTGEQFRAELARHLLSKDDPIVIDEFTSVVDRQVAHIGSHAIAKYVRKNNRRFVAVTCHYDVIEWLQPDWILEPGTMAFRWRSVQRRPNIAIEIARVDKSAWQLFAPFHYLTADLHSGAACFVLFVDGEPASFAAVLHMPISKYGANQNLKRFHRNVTLPDYQGLGSMFVLIDTLGAAYAAAGFRLRNYPAHPIYVRAHDRSSNWRLIKKPGTFASKNLRSNNVSMVGAFGGRPCAVFEYVGAIAPDRETALALINGNELGTQIA